MYAPPTFECMLLFHSTFVSEILKKQKRRLFSKMPLQDRKIYICGDDAYLKLGNNILVKCNDKLLKQINYLMEISGVESILKEIARDISKKCLSLGYDTDKLWQEWFIAEKSEVVPFQENFEKNLTNRAVDFIEMVYKGKMEPYLYLHL